MTLSRCKMIMGYFANKVLNTPAPLFMVQQKGIQVLHATGHFLNLAQAPVFCKTYLRRYRRGKLYSVQNIFDHGFDFWAPELNRPTSS